MAAAMTKHLIGLALGISLLGLIAGCSSDDSGGGGEQVSLAKAACSKQVADGCGEDSFCEENLLDGSAEAQVFECEAEYTALLECMTQATWMCTSAEYFGGPADCSTQNDALDDCKPGRGYSGGFSGGCEGFLQLDGGSINAKCEGVSCTCSDGAKLGAAFSISECEPAPLWGGMLAHCQ